MERRLELRPKKSLAMTFQLTQALSVLQMPQAELKEYLRDAVDKNPLLEGKEKTSPLPLKREVQDIQSVYDLIDAQILESFEDEESQTIARTFKNDLDEKGFLSSPFEQNPRNIRVLRTLQTFDPPGIFARNLQECLSIQLKRTNSLEAIRLVEENYDDLLHNRLEKLEKKYPSLSSLLETISRLQMRPLDSLNRETAQPIFPDLCFEKTDTGWEIRVDESEIPEISLINTYESDSFSKEEKKTVQKWVAEGRGILGSLSRRKEILLAIGVKIIKRQAKFLLGAGPLQPLTIEELQRETQMHESTLSRALSGKYAKTPRGFLPLKSFITTSFEKKQAKQILLELIQSEDKSKPLTDDRLAIELGKRGHKVARRTVSKYRSELNLGSAKTRKFRKPCSVQ